EGGLPRRAAAGRREEARQAARARDRQDRLQGAPRHDRVGFPLPRGPVPVVMRETDPAPGRAVLSKKDDAEVVREVTACIDQAIAKNHRQEWLAITTLVLLFLAGLGLLVYGAIAQVWQLLVPGGLVQLTVVFP